MSPLDAFAILRAHALSLPETREDFPWGERVVKVKDKVLVFLGKEPGEEELGFSVKLPVSGADLLARGLGVPTGYGLGKAGWVSLRLGADAIPDEETLQGWIEESYRAVAPKRLAARVPERR